MHRGGTERTENYWPGMGLPGTCFFTVQAHRERDRAEVATGRTNTLSSYAYTIIMGFTRFCIRPKTLFLPDGLGALLSALCLGVVLVRFEAFFGMPRAVLYPLAGVAGLFAVYSLCCYVFVIQNRSVFLRVIATANLIYGCVTVGLLVLYRQELTLWGVGILFRRITDNRAVGCVRV